MLQHVQSAFGSAALAVSLAATFARPTTPGNMLTLTLRFSPLTGTPEVADNYANRFRQTATHIDGATAVAVFVVNLERTGAGHSVTANAQGGAQSLEFAVSEWAIRGEAKQTLGDELLAEQKGIKKLLRRLVKAQRG